VKYWKAHLAVIAVIVVVGTILGGILAEPVWAQVRAALVKDVDNPSRQPFTGTATVDFAPGLTGAGAPLLVVPAGKRAVVEHVSCINYLDAANNFVRFEMQYTSGGVVGRHQFVNTRVGASFVSFIDVWSFSQPVQAYADPSTGITINAFRRATTGAGGIECYISGHYVDTAL
jgi:hypothetical protein